MERKSASNNDEVIRALKFLIWFILQYSYYHAKGTTFMALKAALKKTDRYMVDEISEFFNTGKNVF